VPYRRLDDALDQVPGSPTAARGRRRTIDAAIISCMSERIDYVELPGGDLAATKSFYASAFGWGFTDYGPTYAGLENAGLDGGLATGDAAMTAVPLVLLKADALEDALARVEAAGGTITAPIFEFPGGRRFHFRDPAGNELGVWGE
jgi:predicted enzyme related to lactoylglutathione lyase